MIYNSWILKKHSEASATIFPVFSIRKLVQRSKTIHLTSHRQGDELGECVDVCIHLCVSACTPRAQRSVSHVFLSQLSILFAWNSPSLAKLASQWAPGTLWSLPTHHWDAGCVPPYLAFLCALWGLNPGLHAWQVLYPRSLLPSPRVGFWIAQLSQPTVTQSLFIFTSICQPRLLSRWYVPSGVGRGFRHSQLPVLFC